MKRIKTEARMFNGLTRREHSLVNLWVQAGGTWERNDKGFIDVNGDVLIENDSMERLPVRFGEVTGTFICRDCPNLKTLMGSPLHVRKSTFQFQRCKGLPKEEIEIVKDGKTYFLWMESGMELKEFLVRRRGQLKGDKFGI